MILETVEVQIRWQKMAGLKDHTILAEMELGEPDNEPRERGRVIGAISIVLRKENLSSGGSLDTRHQ